VLVNLDHSIIQLMKNVMLKLVKILLHLEIKLWLYLLMISVCHLLILGEI